MVPVPRTPRRQRQLTRDQRLRARLLRETIGENGRRRTYADIAHTMQVTTRAIQIACAADRPTPRRRSGRRLTTTAEQEVELINWVQLSAANRQMQWERVAERFGWSYWVVRRIFRANGYHRCIALRKPPLSPVNKIKRFNWAEAHVNWTWEQWNRILWTDETWTTNGKHRRVRVTRRAGEQLDPTCIVDKIQRRKGWMFWGSIAGSVGLGPALVWEKEWGSITAESYTDHIVPQILAWLDHNPGHSFMQDSAPSHAARMTRGLLRDWGVDVMTSPPYSPDLNPIETLWCILKDALQRRMPVEENWTQDELRDHLTSCWTEIEREVVDELIDTMQARCQAVIDADGGYTRF